MINHVCKELCNRRGQHQQQRRDTINKQVQDTYESSIVVLVIVHMLQICGHLIHVVVFVSAFLSLIQLLSMFPHIHLSTVREFLVIVDTAKTDLWKCRYTHRRLQQTVVSSKRSICNKNKIVEALRLRFYPKIEHNRLPRSVINLRMHPLSSTFFEFFLRPPGSTPLPPSGGRTR